MNEIITIQNIPCYEEDGIAYLSLEVCARGLGFTQEKNGSEYVRWETVQGYLNEIGLSQQVGKNGFIPENIFYRLAMKAKNETAERFQALVADEIIPSIRKHGMYATIETVEAMLGDPDVMIQMLTTIKTERAERVRLEAKVAQDSHKVLFADSVAASDTTILVGELAKLLKQNGYESGQNRLFEALRKDGYLIIRKGTDFNMPTQRSMEMGLFSIKETAITHADGHVTVNKTPKVTGKGQVYFVNRYCRQKSA